MYVEEGSKYSITKSVWWGVRCAGVRHEPGSAAGGGASRDPAHHVAAAAGELGQSSDATAACDSSRL